MVGGTLFGWLSYALKTAHNFAGPVFAVSLLIVIVTFARDNLPRAGLVGKFRRKPRPIGIAPVDSAGGAIGAQDQGPGGEAAPH